VGCSERCLHRLPLPYPRRKFRLVTTARCQVFCSQDESLGRLVRQVRPVGKVATAAAVAVGPRTATSKGIAHREEKTPLPRSATGPPFAVLRSRC